MTRKPIQISYFGGNAEYVPCLSTLCDDGTIWEKLWDEEDSEGNPKASKWMVVDDVPQDSLADLNLGDGICAHCGHAKRNKYMKCTSCGSKENKD